MRALPAQSVTANCIGEPGSSVFCNLIVVMRRYLLEDEYLAFREKQQLQKLPFPSVRRASVDKTSTTACLSVIL